MSLKTTPFSAFIERKEASVNIPVVTGYSITVENMVTKATRTVYVEGSTREANMTGLAPFTEYSVTVTAEYKYGPGPPSEAVTQSTSEHGKWPNPFGEAMCITSVYIIIWICILL